MPSSCMECIRLHAIRIMQQFFTKVDSFSKRQVIHILQVNLVDSFDIPLSCGKFSNVVELPMKTSIIYQYQKQEKTQEFALGPPSRE